MGRLRVRPITIKTGPRRTKVQIQAETLTPDALNQLIPSWTTIATVRGLKRDLSGDEVTNASQTKAIADSVIETWYLPSITVTPAHRLLINGAQLGIRRVVNVEDKNETLLIYCTGQIVPAVTP
jgi:SPP1 family predicted phage head-tail adaptor